MVKFLYLWVVDDFCWVCMFLCEAESMVCLCYFNVIEIYDIGWLG